jgi:hypothetical protein
VPQAKKEGNADMVTRLEGALKAAFEAKQKTLRPEIQLLNRLLSIKSSDALRLVRAPAAAAAPPALASLPPATRSARTATAAAAPAAPDAARRAWPGAAGPTAERLPL